jgi:hypothetical protein
MNELQSKKWFLRKENFCRSVDMTRSSGVLRGGGFSGGALYLSRISLFFHSMIERSTGNALGISR